jgi:hypothetical protein
MAGAFRDDLEAARSRVDALREENEELRDELDLLRHQRPADAPPAPDGELVQLAERTLSRLEDLNEEVDAAAPPVSTPDLISLAPLARSAPPPPHPRAAETATLEPVDVAADDDLGLALLRDRVETATREHRELERLRRAQSQVPTLLAFTFVAGAILGAVLALAAR